MKRMTEQEFRQSIAEVLLATYHAASLEISISEVKDIGLARILLLIKEAGYVRLADDQSLPSLDDVTTDLFGNPCNKSCHKAEQHRMLKANFRKVD